MTVPERMINFCLRASGSLKSRLRVRLLRLGGARVGNGCWLRKISVPRNPWDIQLADNVALDDGVVLLTTGERGGQARIRIDRGVYINRYTMIDITDSIAIGAGTMIGPFCYLTDHDHVQASDGAIVPGEFVTAPVSIGRDVWIGAGAVILKGVSIGDGAVVGAGGVVSRSVPPGARVVGVPAREKRAMTSTTETGLL
ncbi:MAG TPA: acyltransferase [Hyphomicrobiaceae bacterium]|nr:acyltransferase [Hyphomicrobiaceae bacterium]